MVRSVGALMLLAAATFIYVGCSNEPNPVAPSGDFAGVAFPPEVDPTFAAVGGRVWFDTNEDGIQDDTLVEPGVEGVMVYLFDCAGLLLDSTYATEGGYYFFDSLPFGADVGYTLGYVFPEDTDFWPRSDEVTDLLPIWLGTPSGTKSILVTDASMAMDFLGQKEYGKPSNGITKLYAQLLAAKLNIVNGAADADIVNTIASADAFLADNDWNDWRQLDKTDKDSVSAWHTMLDDYNNGIIGPGHCLNEWAFSPQNQGADDTIDSDPDPLTGLTACIAFPAAAADWTVAAGMYLIIDENCTRTIGYWKNHAVVD